jgi:hypothetical protein
MTCVQGDGWNEIGKMLIMSKLDKNVQRRTFISPYGVCAFFFFSWWYWVWIQGLALARQALYHLNHSTSPCLCLFENFHNEKFLKEWKKQSCIKKTSLGLAEWLEVCLASMRPWVQNPSTTKKKKKKRKKERNLTGWYMPVIPVLERLRQEDHKFKATLGPCL